MAGGDIFAFLACQRAVIDHKIHGNGGFGYLLERNGFRVIRGTDGIADMDIRNTGDGNDGTNSRLLHLHSLKTVKLIELSYLDFLKLIRLMMVYQNTFLVHLKSPVVHTSDADTANELVVVNGAYEHLGLRVRISLRCRDMVYNGFKQGTHVRFRILNLVFCESAPGRCVDKGAVQLLIRCVQVHHKLQRLVYDIPWSGLRPVNLVDAYDDGQVQIQRLLKHELSLGHGALIGVHYQYNAVHHLEHTLHLAAEISVSWCVDDVNFCVFIKYSRVLGQDGDSSLTLQVIGVHNTLLYLLVYAEHAALPQ